MLKRKRFSVAIIFSLLLLVGCTNPLNAIIQKEEPAKAVPASTTIKSDAVEPKEQVPTVTTATLAAVGDILIHKPVYTDAATGTNTYDFRPMFAAVKPFMENADITFANSESIVGGQEIGVSTYPSFNSPYEVSEALVDSGVDVVSMANNHTLDRGVRAIENAVQQWDKLGTVHTGAYLTPEATEEIATITQNDITFSFLAYTYGTNGIPSPKDRPYVVNRIDQEKLKQDIARAKEQSDVVVVSLHFGNEYERMPNDAQKQLAQFAVDQGARIIIGHHPHVLQPTEWLTAPNGDQAYVIYSLGNFISSQNKLYRQIGGIAKLEVVKTVTGDERLIELKNPQFLPTFVKSSNWRNYRVVPMRELTNRELANAQAIYQETKQHMSQWMPDMSFGEAGW